MATWKYIREMFGWRGVWQSRYNKHSEALHNFVTAAARTGSDTVCRWGYSGGQYRHGGTKALLKKKLKKYANNP